MTAASGHKILPDIMLLRLLELAGLALLVAATPSLARALGATRPSRFCWAPEAPWR